MSKKKQTLCHWIAIAELTEKTLTKENDSPTCPFSAFLCKNCQALGGISGSHHQQSGLFWLWEVRPWQKRQKKMKKG